MSKAKKNEPAWLHIMKHTTGWESATPLFRNHFCTGPECDNWAQIQALCVIGLMRHTRKPSALSGGDDVFGVTPAGIDVLLRMAPLRGARLASWHRDQTRHKAQRTVDDTSGADATGEE